MGSYLNEITAGGQKEGLALAGVKREMFGRAFRFCALSGFAAI